MNAILKTLAEFGITAITITGLIAYLGKRVFEHYLNLKVDSFKNDLERINYEHQIRFNKLHVDRVEIIKKIFIDFTKIESLVRNVTTTWQGPEWKNNKEREMEAMKYINDSKSNFEENKIYFSKTLCIEIDSAIKVCISFIEASLSVKRQYKREIWDKQLYLQNEQKGESALCNWGLLESESQIKLANIRESIADRFRELYGVE